MLILIIVILLFTSHGAQPFSPSPDSLTVHFLPSTSASDIAGEKLSVHEHMIYVDQYNNCLLYTSDAADES